LKEIHNNHGKSLKKSRHNIKISSIPATPDLYEDEKEENYENQNDILHDRNTKIRLKVSINEIPETVQCSTRTEDAAEINIREQDENEEEHQVVSEEDEKKEAQETKRNKNGEEREDESEETVSIQEDISAGETTEDEEDGNTYTIDEK
jgi:hypothetical protein